MIRELPLVGDEFGGYRLRAVLGRGGMSVVYQAENPRLGNVIALKVLAPNLATDDVFRTRFLEESRIAASLNHPNVIPIYDTGSSEGLLYIAMRYVPGTDLRQMLKKRGRLLPFTAVFLLGQAARALDAAHRKGLVHRDVKPGNLLIERGDDDGDPDHLYLTDFGITKYAASSSGLTPTGELMGTLDYVAPEQIQGISVLGLADQYSLGCVMYECLTGRVPFEKDLAPAVLWAHLEKSPTMPTALRPDLPPAVDDVFSRVLAKRPGDRYGSCREFVDAMRAALGDLAVDAHTLGTLDTHAGNTPDSQHTETLTRRTDGGTGGEDRSQPPERNSGGSRRRHTRPGWIAALVALLLVAAGLGTWSLVSGSSGSGGHPAAMASMTAKPKPTAPSALMAALTLANQSGEAKGLLPPATCKQDSATMVTCTGPAPGISQVVFRTYPSLPALYDAYTAKVKALNSGSFQQNINDCEINQTSGEVGWNHAFQHPKNFSVAQMSAGTVTDDQAAGRVFCTFNSGQENFAWTQDDGHLLAWVEGPVHEDVWNWWVGVHHNIGLSGSAMHM